MSGISNLMEVKEDAKEATEVFKRETVEETINKAVINLFVPNFRLAGEFEPNWCAHDIDSKLFLYDINGDGKDDLICRDTD